MGVLQVPLVTDGEAYPLIAFFFGSPVNLKILRLTLERDIFLISTVTNISHSDKTS